MINFTDVIKGKFLEEFSAISLGQILTGIALAFVLSLFIVFIYRVTYGGVSMDRSFVACTIMLTMVTTVVILVISSNVVLSLGMVGALSIVRFRTAVKEPSDTAFLFWAIATGILCGAGYVTVSILATVLLGLLFVGVHAFSKKQSGSRYLLVARYDLDSPIEDRLQQLPGFVIRNKTLAGDYTELVAEIRLSNQALTHLDNLRTEAGVREISVMHACSTGL